MSTVRPDNLTLPQQRENWRGVYPAATRDYGGPSWGLLVTGLVVVGLGILVWRQLGPDLRRYLKIERM